MDKRFYVTTPIYYVNAEPHLGHAYTTVLADFLKRFYAMLGYDAYMLTGTDEHGDKIVKAAAENGSTVQEYTDRISGSFRDAWRDIGIDFDDFIRTTEERHRAVVQTLLQRVYDKGDIYFSRYGGHYCVGCERFFTEKEMVDGKCPDHDRPLDFIEEENYFFRMSTYQKWLAEYIESHPDFIRPERYKNEVLSLLKSEQLEDLCISRPASRLTWGIPLPFDDKFVTYVWFDALINYISGIGYPDDPRFAKYWPASHHLIAKDIVKPHGIFWPIMLKSAGIEPFAHLNVHGYWNMDKTKMSKSLGNVVRPRQLIDKFGNDQIRYFFLREMTFGLDAKFSEEAIINRNNYDLANDLGNLVRRSISMTAKYFDGTMPAFNDGEPAERDQLKQQLAASAYAYIDAVNRYEFSVGIEALWGFVRLCNKYIDDTKPWQLFAEKKTALLSSVMRNIMESIHAIALLLEPICITASPRIVAALGAGTRQRTVDAMISLELLQTGAPIADPGILFPRYEIQEEPPVDQEKSVEKKSGVAETPSAESDNLVDIKEFGRLDLRVAQVLAAVRVEGSEKLLRLEIDTGIDKRTIVAGIAQHYTPEYMTGKKIIVVANLKPAVIFKQKSFGMLLAAKKEAGDRPVLIEIDQSIPVGSRLG